MLALVLEVLKLALIVGGFIWHKGRPKLPNATAIQAPLSQDAYNVDAGMV
jgi:hypothetical protein